MRCCLHATKVRFGRRHPFPNGDDNRLCGSCSQAQLYSNFARYNRFRRFPRSPRFGALENQITAMNALQASHCCDPKGPCSAYHVTAQHSVSRRIAAPRSLSFSSQRTLERSLEQHETMILWAVQFWACKFQEEVLLDDTVIDSTALFAGTAFCSAASWL